MEYTVVAGIKISKIALGCADFGTKVDKETSFKLMDRYFELGGNVLDTGRVYCSWLENGANKSESTIGEFLKTRDLRNKAIIATKGGHPPISNMQQSRINKEEIEKDLNESLHYLNVDYIDIYYLHRDDENKPVSEIIEFLNEFVRQGKIRFLGASNWKIERILAANKYAKEHNLAGFTFSEIMWSYARINPQGLYDKSLVSMNEKEYKLYKENSLIVMAFSSQAQGFYSNLDKGIDSLSDMQKEKFVNETNLKRYNLIKELGVNTCSLTAVGLNALTFNKEINTIPIVGGFSIPLLEDSLAGINISQNAVKTILDNFDY